MAKISKRSAPRKHSAGREQSDADYGGRMAGNVGASVSDGAGTRSRAGLPPATRAMAAPKAELPPAAKALASATLPVPGIDDKLINVHEPWDLERDRAIREGR
jgi:hypothetical protein